MSSSSGTKVTKDPQAFNDPKNENPGVVTSDSLAGESITDGGSFGANSDARGPMNQPSSSTNTNTTDTSSATTLAPAVDAEARQAQEGWSETSQMNAGSSLSKESGSGPSYSAAAGGSENTRPSGGSGSAQGSTAPGYASNPAPSTGDDFKPKGESLQEGGFDSDAPNASFNTDIGGKDDPGRAALGKMEASDVPVAGGAGPREGKISNDGQFDALNETSA